MWKKWAAICEPSLWDPDKLKCNIWALFVGVGSAEMKYLSAICRPRVGLAEVKYLGAICRPRIGGSREGPTCTFQATDDCPNCTALQNQLFCTAKKPDTECCQSQREWMSWPDTLEGGQLCALCWEATRVTCTAKRVVFLSYKDAKAMAHKYRGGNYKTFVNWWMVAIAVLDFITFCAEEIMVWVILTSVFTNNHDLWSLTVVILR